MQADRLSYIRDNFGTLAAIVCTRNATWWLVDENGNSPGRWSVVEWNDEIGVVTLQNNSQIRSDQMQTLQHISYDPIDELITIQDVASLARFGLSVTE